MLKSAEQVLIKINSAVITVMLFIMFALVFSNVVTRYIFGFSMNWAEEVSRYLMIWIAYLGAGLAMREGRHAAIEVLQDLLPKGTARYVRALVGLIILAFMGVVAYLGFNYAQFAMSQRTAVLRLPLGLFYYAIPIGALAFILHLVTIFRDYTERTSRTENPSVEVPEQKGVTMS